MASFARIALIAESKQEMNEVDLINLRIPDSWLAWLAAHPRAVFVDLLMYVGFGLLVLAAFLFNAIIGVAIFGTALIALSILIATTSGGSDHGDA